MSSQFHPMRISKLPKALRDFSLGTDHSAAVPGRAVESQGRCGTQPGHGGQPQAMIGAPAIIQLIRSIYSNKPSILGSPVLAKMLGGFIFQSHFFQPYLGMIICLNNVFGPGYNHQPENHPEIGQRKWAMRVSTWVYP